MIAPQLLIPFIENCFKHGVNKAMKEGFVDVSIAIHDGELQMVVANSKAPQSSDAIDRRVGGIGLTNVRRRLNLLYPDAYQLNINNTIDTYEVNFTLALEQITT
jgi:LytS/YehU family sensor histidine kinase